MSKAPGLGPTPVPPPPDPGDDVSGMCVNLRILSRLAAGEKLRSVRDQYYAVEDGSTYQSAILRYLRRDSREQTCAALEVGCAITRRRASFCDARNLTTLALTVLCQNLFARVAAVNNKSQTVPLALIASASRGLSVLMDTYAQDKQVVSRLEQVQQRYCPPHPQSPRERAF